MWQQRSLFYGYLNPWVIAIICIILLLCCIFYTIRVYQQSIRNVFFMLEAIRNGDHTMHFNENDTSGHHRQLNRILNQVNNILYDTKRDIARQEKYYEAILEHINTGVLVLTKDGRVQQLNSQTLRLLGLDSFYHLKQLRHIDEALYKALNSCTPGNHLQMNLQTERDTRCLSIHVSPVVVKGESLRLLTLNDIHAEMDNKEIETWNRLTRVLTHEIMNAVTPISSLSDSLLELENDKEIKDGLLAIQRTSKSLLNFVESYRKLTRIPNPEPTLFYLKGFLQHQVQLAKHQYPEPKINFIISVQPEDLILHADENLIGQVVTNLLKNAIQSFSDVHNRDIHTIKLRASCDEVETINIDISNNGPAIPTDVREHIFTPFFTTKTDGSGIGLSISRQIMRLSGGNITLLSNHSDTTFRLTFY